MQNNTNTIGADFARIQCELESIRFHAQRLRDASLNAGSATVAEPRIIEACQLAEHVLCTIDFLPALYATPVEVAL